MWFKENADEFEFIYEATEQEKKGENQCQRDGMVEMVKIGNKWRDNKWVHDLESTFSVNIFNGPSVFRRENYTLKVLHHSEKKKNKNKKTKQKLYFLSIIQGSIESDNQQQPAQRTEQSSIDASSPLYMHPLESAGAMLVPVQFNGIGYRSWRRGVLRALSVKNKLGFINGECKKPEFASPQHRQWERCDDIVTSWILNSLSKEIADSVEYVNDSTELWKELDDRYD
ncbi:uncharacterized protein LOC132612115 [Lycium barbarum]|uniref:uncharacterized protein LOC132612115 n=1 Tax=Lycium barbarum TaxID=112863 RepID=UPI00293E27B0|nr:uncharacterized protein LOC132612115 [Lycium barbarum]